MSDLIETAPWMELSVHDIEHLVEELRAYHAIYRPLFQRREQREAAYTSLQGLLAPLSRKSIEPMVLVVDGVAPRPCEPYSPLSVEFIPLSFWYDAPLISRYSDRRHDPWLVYGLSSCRPARWSFWISRA